MNPRKGQTLAASNSLRTDAEFGGCGGKFCMNAKVTECARAARQWSMDDVSLSPMHNVGIYRTHLAIQTNHELQTWTVTEDRDSESWFFFWEEQNKHITTWRVQKLQSRWPGQKAFGPSWCSGGRWIMCRYFESVLWLPSSCNMRSISTLKLGNFRLRTIIKKSCDHDDPWVLWKPWIRMERPASTHPKFTTFSHVCTTETRAHHLRVK